MIARGAGRASRSSCFLFSLSYFCSMATRKLFARFPGETLPKNIDELRDFFEGLPHFEGKLLGTSPTAYLNFSCVADAKLVLEKVNAKRLNGRVCFLEMSPPSRVVRIGGAPTRLSISQVEEILTAEFSPFGEIENIIVRPGESTAFVRFIDQQHAVAAVEALQEIDVDGWKWNLEFDKVINFLWLIFLHH